MDLLSSTNEYPGSIASLGDCLFPNVYFDVSIKSQVGVTI